MVQEERRENDAHTPIREGETERIPCDRGAPRGEPRMRDLAVDAEEAGAHPMNGRRLDQVPPHVPGAAPQIENREVDSRSAEAREKREEAAPQLWQTNTALRWAADARANGNSSRNVLGMFS